MNFIVLDVSGNRPVGPQILAAVAHRGHPPGGNSMPLLVGSQVYPRESDRRHQGTRCSRGDAFLFPRPHDFLPIASTSIPPGDDRSWVDVRPRTCLEPPIPWTGPSIPPEVPNALRSARALKESGDFWQFANSIPRQLGVRPCR